MSNITSIPSPIYIPKPDITPSPVGSGSPINSMPAGGDPELVNLNNAFAALNRDGRVETFASGTRDYSYLDAAPYMSGFGSSGFVGPNSAEYNATNQRWYHQLVNGVGKGLGLAVGTFVNSTAGFINGIGAVAESAANGQLDFSGMYDNTTTNAMDAWSKNMEKWLPNYYSKKELSASALSPDNWFTMNFLADKLIKNSGFAVGALAAGWGTSALLRAAGIGKLATAFNRSVKAGENMEGFATGLSIGDDAMAQGGKAIDLAKKFQTSTQVVENKLINEISNAISTFGEANMEALEGYKNIKEQLITQKQNELHTMGIDRPLNMEELENIEARAKSAGNKRWALNATLLNVTNRITMPAIMGDDWAGSRKRLGRQLNEYGIEGADKTVRNVGMNTAAKAGEKYTTELAKKELGRLGSIWKGAQKAAGIVSGPEMFEEGMQYAFQKATEYQAGIKPEDGVYGYLDKSFDPANTSLLEDIISKGIPSIFSDKEGIESLILGGLTGGGMNMIGGGERKMKKDRDANTKMFIGLANENRYSPYIKERLNAGVANMATEEQKADAIAANDPYQFQNAREDGFFNFAMPRLFYQRKGMAVDEVMQHHSSRMKFDVAKAELGLSDHVTSADLDKMIEGHVKTLDEMDEMLNHVESIQPMMYTNKGDINLNSKGMLYALYKINKFDKRIARLGSELAALGVSSVNEMIDPKQRNGKKLEEIRNNAMAELMAIPPTTVDDKGLPIDMKAQRQKLDDLQRLQNVREIFINDYNQIRDGSFFKNVDMSNGRLLDSTKLSEYERYEKFGRETFRIQAYQANTAARKAAMEIAEIVDNYRSSGLTDMGIAEIKKVLETHKGFMFAEDVKALSTMVDNMIADSAKSIDINAFPLMKRLYDDEFGQMKSAFNDLISGKIGLKEFTDLIELDVEANESDPAFKTEYDNFIDAINNHFERTGHLQELKALTIQKGNNTTLPSFDNDAAIKRRIADFFSQYADVVLESYDLDPNGFSAVDEAEAALGTLKNLKRIFDERGEEFFKGKPEFENGKAAYIKMLDDKITRLETALTEIRKNAEAIEKEDLNFANFNMAFKAAVLGWDHNTKTVSIPGIYDVLVKHLPKAEVDDALAKYSADGNTGLKHAYELYEMVRRGVNINPAFKTELKAGMDQAIADAQTILQIELAKVPNQTFTGAAEGRKRPYIDYDLFLKSIVSSNILINIYRKGRNIQSVIDYLNTPEGKVAIANEATPTRPNHVHNSVGIEGMIAILQASEKLRAMNSLNQIVNAKTDFDFVKYWQQLDAQIQALTAGGIVPTMRQLQAIEDLILHVYSGSPKTSTAATDFSNWIYMDGRIGSGKTKVVATTFMKVIKALSPASINTISYVMGDLPVVGTNLELALKETGGITDFQAVTETSTPGQYNAESGRGLQTFLDDAATNPDKFKTIQFILADEFGRPSNADLKAVNDAVAALNAANGTDIKVVAMGDVKQKSANMGSSRINNVSTGINIATTLGSSYRSPLFSMNVVQSLFDNANFNNRLTQAQREAEFGAGKGALKLVSLRPKTNNGEIDYNSVWYGVTGVAPGTSMADAEQQMILEVIKRSNAKDASGKSITGQLLVIVHEKDLDRIKADLASNGADMTMVHVKTVTQAQGLTYKNVYVHLNPAYYTASTIDEMNSDLYTSIRANQFIHVTTLEAENIEHQDLAIRYQDAMNRMQKMNTGVQAEVKDIRAHLESAFKVPPVPKPTAAPGASASPTTETEEERVKREAKEAADAAAEAERLRKEKEAEEQRLRDAITVADKISVGNDNLNKINKADADLLLIKSQIAKLKNDLGTADLAQAEAIAKELKKLSDKISDLEKTIISATAIIEKADADVKALEPGNNTLSDIITNIKSRQGIRDNVAVDVLNALKQASDKIAELKKIPIVIPASAEDESDITEFDIQISNSEFEKAPVVSIKATFYKNGSTDRNSAFVVANPTSNAFKRIGNNPPFSEGDKIIMLAYKKKGKNLVGVFRFYSDDNGVLTYQELGTVDTATATKLFGSDLNSIPRFDVTAVDGSKENTLYTLFNNGKSVTDPSDLNIPGVINGKLSDLNGLEYSYGYESEFHNYDNRELNKLVDLWFTYMGITNAADKMKYTTSIVTFGSEDSSAFKRVVEQYKAAYGDSPNSLPIKPGYSYIKINKGNALPQFIELEPRHLILDSTALNESLNFVIRDWYINPLMSFVKSVKVYDNELKRALENVGIDFASINAVTENEAVTYSDGEGNSVIVKPHLSSFKHGNSIYNDILYLLSNMSFDEKHFESEYFLMLKKENLTHFEDVKNLYRKIFTAINGMSPQARKDLMNATREVWKSIYGAELPASTNVDDKNLFYSFDLNKVVTEDERSGEDIPIIKFPKKFNLKGAQIAMNMLAGGNQNLWTDDNGIRHFYNLGEVRKSKDPRQNGREVVTGRYLNTRQHPYFNKNLRNDNMIINAMLQTGKGDLIRFGGYQDIRTIQYIYDTIRDEQATDSFKDIPYDVSNPSASFGSDSWNTLVQAVSIFQSQYTQIGNSAESIETHILNKSEEGYHKFGNRSYPGGISRPVGLRINIPNSSIDFNSPADSNASSGQPRHYNQEDRFRLMFTSNFTGVRPTGLSVSVPGFDGSEMTTPDPIVEETPVEPITPVNEVINTNTPINSDLNNAAKPFAFEYEGAVIVMDDKIINEISDLKDANENEIDINGKSYNIDKLLSAYDKAKRDRSSANLQLNDSESNMPTGEVLDNANEMLAYLKRFIPDITLEDLVLIEELKYISEFGEDENGGRLFGAFRNGIIYAMQNRKGDPIFKQVLKHEAFHKIFRQYLTPTQRMAILEQAREEYNLFELSDIEVEEWLAVNFQKRPDFKRQSLLQTFLAFLRKLYRLIFRHGNTIEDFFKQIENGQFKKPVAEEYQMQNQNAVYLSVNDIFKNQEDLIKVLRITYERARKLSENQSDEPSYYQNSEGQLVIKANTIAINSVEKASRILSILNSRRQNLRFRFVKSMGQTYYKTADDSKPLSKDELLIYNGPLYLKDETNNSFVQVSSSQRPLSLGEKRELDVLRIVFKKEGLNMPLLEKLKLESDTVYPYLLKFISTYFPQDIPHLETIMGVDTIKSKMKELESAVNDQEDNDETNAIKSELTELNGVFFNTTDLEGIDILQDILKREKGVEASSTLTEAVKTWISGLYIRDNNGIKSIPIPQALAIMYTTFDLFPTENLGRLKEALVSAFKAKGVDKKAFTVFDPNYIIHVMNSNPNSKAYQYLKLVADEKGIDFSEANVSAIIKELNTVFNNIVRTEVNKSVGSILKKGDLSFYDLLNNVSKLNLQQLLLNARALREKAIAFKGGNERDIFKVHYNQETADHAAAISRGARFNSALEGKENAHRRSNLSGIKQKEGQTLEEYNAKIQNLQTEYDYQAKLFVERRNANYELALNKFLALSKSEKEKVIPELAADRKDLQKGLKKQIDDFNETLNKNKSSYTGSDYIRYSGNEAEIVVLQQLIKLIDDAYASNVEYRDFTESNGIISDTTISIPIGNRFRFTSPNHFSIQGVVYSYFGKSNEEMFNSIVHSLYNQMDLTEIRSQLKGFQKRRGKEESGDFVPYNSTDIEIAIKTILLRQVNALYKKYQSNLVLLDILNGFNNLVPTNLTAFESESTSDGARFDMKTKQEDDVAAKNAITISEQVLSQIKVIDQKTQTTHLTFKPFNELYEKLESWKRERGSTVTTNEIMYKQILQAIGQSAYYQESLSQSDLKSVLDDWFQIFSSLKVAYEKPVIHDDDSNSGLNVFHTENRSYFRKVSEYIYKSSDYKTSSSVRDINGETRFTRQRKSYADTIIDAVVRKSNDLEYIKERFPHLIPGLVKNTDYLALNPFNKFGVFGPMFQFHNNRLQRLDGTLNNDYPISLSDEGLKDALARMFNGQFMGQMTEFVAQGKRSNILVGSYPISDKSMHTFIKSGVLSNTGERSVKTMIRTMLIQRIMLPATFDEIKEYRIWKNANGLYHLKGLERIPENVMKGIMDKISIIQGTISSRNGGNLKTLSELEAEVLSHGIDLDVLENAIAADIEFQSNRMLEYIRRINHMALDITGGDYFSNKYGFQMPANLAEIYTKLYRQGVLKAEDFTDNADIEFVHTSSENASDLEKEMSIKLPGYNISKYSQTFNDGHIKPLIKLFIGNTYVNDFFFDQLVTGDIAFYKDAVTKVKRLAVAHGNVMTPTVSDIHAPSIIRTAVTEDVVVMLYHNKRDRKDWINELGIELPELMSPESFNKMLADNPKHRKVLNQIYKQDYEATDGNGWMSQRGRDEMNNGFGPSNQMTSSLKPLAHWHTSHPMSNKYALTVLTDNLVRQYPKLLQQRIKMDFHGLSPAYFALAKSLEEKRIYSKLNRDEEYELSQLYRMAKPIIQQVPKSAIKYGLPTASGITKYNYDTNEYDAFNPNSVFELSTHSWGVQLNPNDEVDGQVSLPTQLMYMANVNGKNPEQYMKLLEALQGFRDISETEYRELGIDGANTNITAIRNLVVKHLSGKENHLNTIEALEMNPAMINLPLFSMSASSSLSTGFNKHFVKFKFNGTKAVQVADALTENVDLEPLNWDPITQTAEVYMPPTLELLDKLQEIPGMKAIVKEWKTTREPRRKRELEKQMIDAMPMIMMGYRIPTTGVNSAVRIKIKGFIQESQNRVIVPKQLAYRMGSDFDIDTLYIIRPKYLKGAKNALIASALGVDIANPIGFSSHEGGEVPGFKDMLKKLSILGSVTDPETGKSFAISANDIKVWKKAYYNNLFTYTYTDLVAASRNNEDVNKALNFERATSIFPYMAKTINGDEVQQRSLFVVLASLKSKAFADAYAAASEAADDSDESIYNPVVTKKLKDEMNALITKHYNLTDIFDRINLQILNQTGKSLTGVFASTSKTLAYVQSALRDEFRLRENQQFEFNGIKFTGEPKKVGDVNYFADSNNVSSFDELQWLVNAAVDNAKEQILAAMLINDNTHGVVSGALVSGFPLETLMSVLQQPVIEYILEFNALNHDVLTYAKKLVLSKVAKKDIKEMTADAMNLVMTQIMGDRKFSDTGEEGSLDIRNYIGRELNEIKPVQRTLMISSKDPGAKAFHANSTYPHSFSFNNVNYANLKEATEAWKKEDPKTRVEYIDLYRAYADSLPLEVKQELGQYSAITPTKITTVNKSIAEVLVQVRDRYGNKDLEILEKDADFAATQIAVLNIVSKLQSAGDTLFDIQQVIGIMDGVPNGFSDVLDYEHAVAKLFKIETEIPNPRPDLNSIKGFKRIILPASLKGVELKEAALFQGFNPADIDRFHDVYESWHRNTYSPNNANFIMLNNDVAELSSVISNVYQTRPRSKGDEKLSASQADILTRAHIIKALLRKTKLRYVNDQGGESVLDMDTINYPAYQNRYYEDQALYQEIFDMLSKARNRPSNVRNTFLDMITAQPYNVVTRTGELTMKRFNTGDVYEIKQLQRSFLMLDQDLRNEFMSKNPGFKGLWLSPLQIKLIQYAVAMEGLNYGSSKISMFLPPVILDQFAYQLQGIHNEMKADPARYKEIADYLAMTLAAADPNWTPGMRGGKIIGMNPTETNTKGQVDTLLMQNTGATLALGDDQNTILDLSKGVEKENEVKQVYLSKTLKKDGDVFFFLKFLKDKAKASNNDYPVFIHNGFNNMNLRTYVRVDNTTSTNEDANNYVYYRLLPTKQSISTGIPDSVFGIGFDLQSVMGKSVAFITKRSVIDENGVPVMYSNFGLNIGDVLHVVDNTQRGYLQAIKRYQVVEIGSESKLLSEKNREELRTKMDMLDKKRLTVEEKNKLTAEIHGLQIRHKLVEIDSEWSPIQTVMAGTFESKSNPDAFAGMKFLEDRGYVLDLQTINSLLEDDNLYGNNTFDISQFSAEEQLEIAVLIKNGQLKC